MARDRSPERDKARQIWLDSGGTMTAREVAEKVGAKPEQVRKWKSLDNWNAALEAQKPPRKRGGQPGNKNAAGAGAPKHTAHIPPFALPIFPRNSGSISRVSPLKPKRICLRNYGC